MAPTWWDVLEAAQNRRIDADERRKSVPSSTILKAGRPSTWRQDCQRLIRYPVKAGLISGQVPRHLFQDAVEQGRHRGSAHRQVRQTEASTWTFDRPADGASDLLHPDLGEMRRQLPGTGQNKISIARLSMCAVIGAAWKTTSSGHTQFPMVRAA